MSNIVDHIESLMKEQENICRMITIQRSLLNGKPNIITPGRKLLKEGKLNKVRYFQFTNHFYDYPYTRLNYCSNFSGCKRRNFASLYHFVERHDLILQRLDQIIFKMSTSVTT